MNLSLITQQAARQHGHRVALAEGDRQWTYWEFDALVDHLASGLAARFAPGERVGVMMANCAETVMLQFALERASLVRVPINYRYTAHELSTLLRHCSASAVLYDATCASLVETAPLPEALARIVVDAAPGSDWMRLLNAPVAPERLHQATGETLATINYTSGTTGVPKGVMLSHANWMAVYRNMLVDRGLSHDDVVAYVGPLTHASGAYLAPWYWKGARNLILLQPTPQRLVDAIETERVTAFTCVPTFLTKMVSLPGIEARDFSSLRCVGYGAEPIPANTLERAWKLLGPVLWQNYGQTEAMMTCVHLPPQDHLRVPEEGGPPRLQHGLLGRPYTFVAIELRDEAGLPVPTGTVGELTIQGDHVMTGYWNQPEATQATVREGWLWTGDLAVRDAAGCLRLVGRRKEMLICGGFNIYPGEIESLLTSLPGVLESAVVARPDAQWGEIAVAFVVLDGSSAHTAATLALALRPQLGIKTPKAWHLVPELPKNGNGKIDKRALLAQDAQWCISTKDTVA